MFAAPATTGDLPAPQLLQIQVIRSDPKVQTREGVLDRIIALQTEVAIQPIYEGMPAMHSGLDRRPGRERSCSLRVSR